MRRYCAFVRHPLVIGYLLLVIAVIVVKVWFPDSSYAKPTGECPSFVAAHDGCP